MLKLEEGFVEGYAELLYHCLAFVWMGYASIERLPGLLHTLR